MPHKQKENHNHSSKSKKDRVRAKQDALDRKQAIKDAQAALEADQKVLLGNTLPLVEGHKVYEIGCDEIEVNPRYNIKKRCKKHLRNDLRRKVEREEREEEEREREEERRIWQESQPKQPELSDSDSEEIECEYVIYICECCDKKYATRNQFLNHSESRKHRDMAAIFEELGLIVTDVELRGENGNAHERYNDSDDESNGVKNDEGGNESEGWDNTNSIDKDEQEEQLEVEEEYMEEPKGNGFAALALDDDSSSSDSSEEEDEDDIEVPTAVVSTSPISMHHAVEEDQEDGEDSDDIDFDELIYQNRRVRIQNNIDAARSNDTNLPPVPLSFNGIHNPDDYGVNENRVAEVHHRLQKRLAAKGIARNTTNSTDDHVSYAADSVAVGQTLLQQLMEANIDTLQTKLDAYRKHKKECQLMTREFAMTKGNSKALPSQYVRKQDVADNVAKRAIVHHAGSHYHMQCSRSMQFGRTKGLSARHSSQGARLQASRMAAVETARMQTGGGGMKVGKKSKKSNQKSQGEAGGSKKSGGGKGSCEK